MTTTNNDEKYREDFEKFFCEEVYAIPMRRLDRIADEDGERYETWATQSMWLCYFAGRKKGEEEIDDIKRQWGVYFNNQDEIQKLREEVEKWKKEAHKRLNELVNDHWFKKYKEMERLNNSIKRENSFLKDENYVLSLDGNVGIKLPESLNLNKELQLRNDLLKKAVPWVDSYHRSRHHTDLNNGQNHARVDWLKQVEEVVK